MSEMWPEADIQDLWIRTQSRRSGTRIAERAFFTE